MVQVTMMLRAEDEADQVVWPGSEEEGLDFFDNPVSKSPSAFMVFWAPDLTCLV